MPFPNTGNGSLRRWDMPCPPDCVFEVASPSTVQRDLGIKKEWYAWMGVREYWILDPGGFQRPRVVQIRHADAGRSLDGLAADAGMLRTARGVVG